MVHPQEEFREFVKISAASLHRTAYLFCGDWHLANDLVQEALAKIFRNWQRVQRADGPDAYVRWILMAQATAPVLRADTDAESGSRRKARSAPACAPRASRTRRQKDLTGDQRARAAKRCRPDCAA